MPDAVLIAGANGAGKTTFARELLPVEFPGALFLNADEIERLRPGAGPRGAGEQLLHELQAALDQRRDFAVETTLSSARYAVKVREWRAVGYRVTMHFIELPSAAYAIERVRRRVAAGGHGIPEADIRRRYARGLELFQTRYKSVVDVWYHWKSDEKGLRRVDSSDDHLA